MGPIALPARFSASALGFFTGRVRSAAPPPDACEPGGGTVGITYGVAAATGVGFAAGGGGGGVGCFALHPSAPHTSATATVALRITTSAFGSTRRSTRGSRGSQG